MDNFPHNSQGQQGQSNVSKARPQTEKSVQDQQSLSKVNNVNLGSVQGKAKVSPGSVRSMQGQ